MITSESASANKTTFIVVEKKKSRTTSVNVNRVSLQILWNVFLKSVTDSAFSKTRGLSSNSTGSRFLRVYWRVQNTLKHSLIINSLKSLKFYE